MPIWNKYANTAARKHGKPGREQRPQSVTIDAHTHIAIPRAAAFIKPRPIASICCSPPESGPAFWLRRFFNTGNT